MTGKNKIILYAAITVLILAGAGYYSYGKYFGGSDLGQNQPALTVGEWWDSGGPSDGTESDIIPSESGSERGSTGGGELPQTYADDVYDFSFKHPDGFSALKMPDAGGDLILVQGPADKTFQVFVSPFDEPASELTSDRIKFDLPDMEVINPEQIAIGGEGIPALMFNSKHESLGDTREVWFVWPPDPLPHGNYLYQISAYANLDAFLGPILETWRFQ